MKNKQIKQNILKLLVVSFIFFSCYSCREYIDYEIDETERKIVLNGFLTPSETIKINLTKSMSAADLSSDIEFIENAKVELYEDDNFITELTYTRTGFYESDFKPSENKIYRIKVEAAGFKPVIAETKIPPKTNVLEIDGTNVKFYENDDDYYSGYSESGITGNIIFKLNREKSSENYFHIKASKKYMSIAYNSETYEPIDTFYHKETVWYNPAIESDNTVEYLYITGKFEGYVFPDKLSNSEFFDINIELSTYYSSNSEAEYDPWLYLDVINFDESFYTYLKSKNLYSDNEGNPFSEPVNIYSNVENGLGLLTSYSMVSDSVEVIVE